MRIELLDTEKCELESGNLEDYENLFNIQKRVCDAIIDRYQNFVQGSKSNCVFWDGLAGSGKTFLYLMLYNWCLEKKHVMASSGVAASQLPNGTTQFA